MDEPADRGVLQTHLELALQWLRRSMEVCDCRGSSAFYSPWRHPVKRWAPAYPETTGYLLPTLLRARRLVESAWVDACVERAGEWLLDTALEGGAFPELYGHTGKPSLFNTGQILLGLTALWRENKDARYQATIERALEWMLAERWQQRPHPTYFSRAWWGALVAARSLGNEQAEMEIAEVLEELLSRFRANGTLRAWGFQAAGKAYTHTIAYSLRGFYEAGKLLQRIEWADKVWHSLQQIEELYNRRGKLAGSYDENWKGRYSFICVTGHAQLSLLYKLVAEDVEEDFADFYPSAEDVRPTGDEAHLPLLKMSAALLQTALKAQVRKGSQNLRGAVPGSVPFYGPYMPMRYPNWAAKFLADACMAWLK
ncbi:MAG TPA: hypothetical protein ENJ88_01570 [Phaeodactylibacter sp.]|nr:hypothetical protein [Phaeodactylibacter sp.]